MMDVASSHDLSQDTTEAEVCAVGGLVRACTHVSKAGHKECCGCCWCCAAQLLLKTVVTENFSMNWSEPKVKVAIIPIGGAH